MYVPFFGWAAYLSGHEFITRKSGGKDSVSANLLTSTAIDHIRNLGFLLTKKVRKLLHISFLILTKFLISASSEVRDHMNIINERIKKERLRVCVFPEGTRNKAFDGKMLPFKKGKLFRLKLFYALVLG